MFHVIILLVMVSYSVLLVLYAEWLIHVLTKIFYDLQIFGTSYRYQRQPKHMGMLQGNVATFVLARIRP